MQAFGRLSSYISHGVYTVSAPFHPFGGAVDIIVVRQQDGSLKSSPWYVQFGKFQGVLKSREKVVKIIVNGVEAGLEMYLDHKGEAFFLKESDDGADDGPIVSPLTSEDDTDEGPHMRNSQMLEFEANQVESVSKIEVENGKLVTRTNSRSSRIFGLFRRKSMKEDSTQDKITITRLNSLESAQMAADLYETKWSTNLPATGAAGRNLPKPPSRKNAKEETCMNVDEKRSSSSCEDPSCGSHEGNLPKSPSKKDDRGEFKMSIDENRILSSAEELNPCTQVNNSVSGSALANMECSNPMEVTQVSHCIEPRVEEAECSLEINPSLDRDETINDTQTVIREKCSTSVVSDGGVVKISEMERREIITPQDTVFQNSCDSMKAPPLSSDCAVKTVMLDAKLSPQDTLVENSDKALECPSVTTPVNTDVKKPVIDTVEKFKAFEVPSVSSKYTVETVISNGNENTCNDRNVDVSGFRNSTINAELCEHVSEDKGVSSYVVCKTEIQGSSIVSLDLINDELQTSGPTIDRSDLAVNDQQSYGTATFTSEVNLTPELVTPASHKQLAGHDSHCTENSEHCGDLTNLEKGALLDSTECDKTKSPQMESQTPEMQSPSNTDVESYESIVKILQENEIHLQNEEKEHNTTHDNIFENQVQVEEKGMSTTTSDKVGIDAFQHSSSFHDMESKNTTTVTLTSTCNQINSITEQVTIGGTDVPSEILSARYYGPDSCSNSDAVASVDDEIPLCSEDGRIMARKIDTVASCEPSSQHLIADVTFEKNLSQDSRPTSVNYNTSSDDYNEVSNNQSNKIGSPTSASCVGNNSFVTSTSSRVPSDISNLSDSEDSYSVSCTNQSSSSKTNMGENETCIPSVLEEGLVQKQVDPTSNTSELDDDVHNISEVIKVAKLSVEVSLCGHLLLEGMGEEAASKAFDAEKLNLEKFLAAGPEIVKNNKLIVKIGHGYFPWESAIPIIHVMHSSGRDDFVELKGAIPVEKVQVSADQDTSKAVNPSGGSWKLWPFGSTKSKEKGSEDKSPDGSNENGPAVGSDDSFSDIKAISNLRDTKKVRTPSSEQLASLNLKEGRNSVTFNFETAMLGRQQVDALIYLWTWNARIVISDVDGTITKSDVLGQFMPLVGKDWSQTGVAPLFSAIKDNGYQFIFLSARSISQAYITRQFLINLKQDGKALPDGPVVISPDGLFPSLYREVIRRAPHEFKISCLEDIKALFPPDCNPFYAGFGNRHTDEISYMKVGIPKGKIFTINPRGEVIVNRTVDAKSYVSLYALVDAIFPVTDTEQEEFNSWNFWRSSLPDIKI